MKCVGSDVLRAVVMKCTIFRDTMQCSPLKVNQLFGATYCLHLQGRRISRARNQRENGWQENRKKPFLEKRRERNTVLIEIVGFWVLMKTTAYTFIVNSTDLKKWRIYKSRATKPRQGIWYLCWMDECHEYSPRCQHLILHWVCQLDCVIGRGSWSSCGSILTRAPGTPPPPPVPGCGRGWYSIWVGRRDWGRRFLFMAAYLNVNGRFMCLFRLQMNQSGRTKGSQTGEVRRGNFGSDGRQ
jgi:hypothetical protein